MRVAIHQPQYWPWPRYIHKALTADVFVYLDTVQFSKNGLQNRNQIRTQQGALWLTLPVSQRLGQTIRDTRLADARAPRKHFKTLAAHYARTPGFARWKDELETLLSGGDGRLCELAIASTEWILRKLGAPSRRLRASEIAGAGPDAQGSRLVAALCETLGARAYLTGRGALEYMEPADFRAIGCAVEAQTWSEFTYVQFPPGVAFVPDLSTLDLLLNCPDHAAGLIRQAGGWELLWKGE